MTDSDPLQATTAKALGIEVNDVVMDGTDEFVVTDVSDGNYVDVMTEDESYATTVAVKNIGVCNRCGYFTLDSTLNPQTDTICRECWIDVKNDEILKTFDKIQYHIKQLEENKLSEESDFTEPPSAPQGWMEGSNQSE